MLPGAADGKDVTPNRLASARWIGRRFPTRVAMLVAVLAVVAALAWPTAAPAARSRASNPVSACTRNVHQLENAGFENPDAGPTLIQFFHQSVVPGWSTTAADGKMEFWKSGFSGVPAAEGAQFVELNANLVSTLYQDIATTPGETLTWSLSHRGRLGVDTMRVLIGVDGAMVSQGNFSDGNTAWGRHSGAYTVPVGQTCTRFAFESVSAAGGAPSVGNFLDAISFGTPSNVVAEKSVLPTGQVNVGTTLHYSVNAANEGGSATLAASVTDVLPVGVTLVPGTIVVDNGVTQTTLPDSAYNASSRTISTSFLGSSGVSGVIEPGATATLRFDVVVDSGAAGAVLSNTATVSSTTGQGVVSSTTTNTVSTVVNTSTDLVVTLDATGSAQASDPFALTATVANAGPLSAFIGPGGEPAATLVLTIPAAIAITPSSVPTECSQVGQVLTCTRATTLPVTAGMPSLNWVLALTGTISPSAAPATLSSTALLTSYATDFALGNNQASAPTIIVPPTPATLNVTKNVTTPTITAGHTGSVDITVTNSGQLSSNAVTLTDTIPTGFTVTNVTTTAGTCTVTTNVSCSLGILTGGQSVTVHIDGTTDPGLVAGAVLTDVATATDGTTSDTDTGTMSMLAASHLMVLKETQGEALADKPVTYLVTITNLGPSAAHNATIVDQLPAGTTLVATPAGCTLAGQQLTCELGTLAVNQSTAVTYQLNVPDGGTITNSVTASSDSTPVNAPDATDSIDTRVRTDADLRIEETASKTVMKSGDTVELQFRVTNDGPVSASGIEVTNTAPAGLEYLTGDAAGTPLQPGQPVFWNVGTLASGATASATITARLTGRPGSYVNTVTAKATQSDPVNQNDTASVTLTIPEDTNPPAGSDGNGSGGGSGSGSGSSANPQVAGARLALTGVNTQGLLQVGMGLFLGGALLIWAARRRDEESRA